MNATEPLRRAARRWPTREALRCGDASITFAALDRRVDRVARLLQQHGVRPGDRVATWLPNAIAHVVAQQAVLRAGAAWVAVNRRLAPPEIAFMLQHADVRALLTDGPPPDGANAPALAAVLDVGGTDARVEAALAAAPAGPAALPPIEEAMIARLRFTSGTTGLPKAAVLTHGNVVASLRNLLAELHELDSDDVVLHVAPLTHASEALVAPAFWRGARAVIAPTFDPETLAETVARERITTAFLVPTMIASLLDSADARVDLRSLATIVYGASPIAQDVLARALDRFGHVLLQIYGLSECPFPITTLRKEDHVDPRHRTTCGLPTAMNDVRVTGPGGEDLPDGDVGTITVRGPQCMREYWRDPAATAACLVDGWLRTGDLGFRSEEGFLTLVDRSDDVIITGGFNVYPREVEMVLEMHEDVAEVAVAAVPHPHWGQGVAAWVVRRPGREPSARDLIDFCRARLASYKKPVEVRFVDALPKSPTGKVLRRTLRTT